MSTPAHTFRNIFITLAVAALFLVSAPFAFAQATHMSGAEYLAIVNQQRAAAGQSPLGGTQANQLVNSINGIGDTDFATLQQTNNGRPTNWISTAADVGRITNRTAQTNPDGSVNQEVLTKVAAENALQRPAICNIFVFSFQTCIGDPLAIWSSSVMLSLGGAILRLSGAIFDFGVNHVIINFKETIDVKMGLLPIIKDGWTFFRDLANILIIAIFVFIAISLILGLKEYGQKKMVARVLIIAVLMNFSLLFTTIIIDASNFIAFAIYSQTASACSGGGGSAFSVADCVLKPLHVTGTWDTKALAEEVFKQPDGGALKAFSFGLFGFMVLILLAAVIFYGAFLIVARAILFIFLMLTAPIAYATYLAPHFEASEFGWTNWWKSLINNAAFAPLLMMFLSVSILIFQTASPNINARDTIGALLTDPTKQVLADGWSVLFVYIIGTGLLFTSFRLSSSLAGSISGIKLGQMAAGMPLALGFAGAAKGLQYTVGRGLSKAADSKGAQAQTAHMQALNSGKAEDFARAEKLRKQKDMLEKSAKSSFNLMNTAVGKGLTGGLGGILGGQTKGNFKSDMQARAAEAAAAAKAAQVSDKDKAAIRKSVEEEELGLHKKEAENAAKNLEIAKAAMEEARKENAEANDPATKAAAEAQTEKNRSEKGKDLDNAREEVRVVEQKRTEIVAGHDAEIKTMMKEAEGMSGEAHDRKIRDIEKSKAEHASELSKQSEHIKAAHEKISTLETEITEPTRVLEQRQRKARAEMTARENEHKEAQSRLATVQKKGEKLQKTIKDNANTVIKNAENNAEDQTHRIAEKAAGIFGGSTGTHEVQHVFDHDFKKKTNAESLADVIKGLNKSTETPPEAGADHA